METSAENTNDHFEKDYYDIGKPRLKGLIEVFKNFYIDDYRQDIERCKNIAICADQSEYDNCESRENLILFTYQLIRLVEAFYLIRQKNYNDEGQKFSSEVAATIEINSLARDLNKQERENPFKVLLAFSEVYAKPYARNELLDMLDAAIIYEGSLPLYRGNLVLLYRQLDFMVRLCYRITRKKNKIIEHFTSCQARYNR